MHTIRISLILLASLVSNTVFANSDSNNSQSTITIEHAGNAGIKIISGNKIALVDALFGPHSRFTHFTDAEFSTLTKQGANVALATHVHSDHFHPKRATQFLTANSNTLFIGTPEILGTFNDISVTKNIFAPTLADFQSHLITQDDIKVDVLNFPHMKIPNSIQNYAYLVEINGWKILHVGDADVTAEVITGHQLAKRNIDVLVVHDLFHVLQKDYRKLIEQMNVDKVVYMHIMDENITPVSQWLKTNLPDATYLAPGHKSITLTK